MKLGILYERIRKDEKLIIDSAKNHGIDVVLINDTDLIFKLEKNEIKVDLVLERCIDHARALYSMKILNESGIRTINSSATAEICGSKFLVTEALIKNKIPTPKVCVAFNRGTAIKAVEKIGLPCVFKPAIGSWGLLCAKANDMEAAEAIIDHKAKLGSYHHSVFYVQDYIKKPNRDIRVFVIGDEVVDAIYRTGSHWITHVEHGAKITKCRITREIKELALRAAKAVKGDIVAVDMLESNYGLMVLEVDYTIEFSQYFPVLDKKIVDKIIKICKK